MKKTCLVLLLLTLPGTTRPQVSAASAPKAPAAPAPVVQRVNHLAQLQVGKPLTAAGDTLSSLKEGGDVTFRLPKSTRLRAVRVDLRGKVEAGEVEAALIDEHGTVLQSTNPHTGAAFDNFVVTVPKTGASLRLTLRPQTRYQFQGLTLTTY